MIKLKLSSAIAALCLISVLTIALLVYMIERAHRIQDQLELRYQALVGFIEFDRKVYETFMAARHQFFNLDEHAHFDPDAAKKMMEVQFYELEAHILSMAEFLNWPNEKIISEKAVLFRLENEIEIAFEELAKANLAFSEKRFIEAEEIARYIFDVRIGSMFKDTVDAKIVTERDRIDQAQRDIRSISHLTTSLTVLISVFIIGVTLWAIFVLLWQVQRGLDVLARGANRLADGDLTYRIDLQQNNELGQLASVFNGMATQFQGSQDELRIARNELESKVEQRTRELNDANKELQERDERRRQFFADVGHELRTPVTAIRGQAEVALRSKDHHLEARSDALKRIVSLTDQLTQDVSALFFIAREQAGAIDLRQEPVNLGNVVSQVAENMSVYFEREQASVSIQVSPGEEYLIEGTESRLRQLVSILFTNAIIHSHTGVEVDVTVTGTKSRIQLIVSDNGPGIPVSERLRVFERFYRMANHTDNGVTGTGLGLPIAQSLTLAHGGLIRADESQHGGTEIHASFPRYREAEV